MSIDSISKPELDFNERIAGLSAAKRELLALRLKRDSDASREKVTIPQRANRGSSPLSFAQQRLWFLDQLLSGNSPYNIPTAVRLSGLLDVRCLEQSMKAVVIRHEVLRTTIKSVQGKPYQIVADDCVLPLAIHDLSMRPEADKEAEASQVWAVEAQRPFDLTQDLMLRATLIKLSEQEHVLLLVMHHIASDGWSMSILMRELSQFYEAEISGLPSSLPELPIQYADYAEWQLEWLQGEVLSKQLDYWKQQLAGAPTRLDLPTDRPRPAVQTFQGASRQLELSPELTQSLKALSLRENASLFMTLLAAFQVLLFRYTGQDDFVLGSPIAGRNRGEVEELIGFFVNTLALRTDLSGDPTFLEVLQRVRDVALKAYEHQDLPFERLVEELQPERSLSHNPLFQVMFILQNAPDSPLRLSGLESSPMRLAAETTHFDLTMSITERRLGLIATLSYSTDLFEEPTIERMLGHFEVLLEAIAMDASQTLSDLPILTEAERRQLLVEWNDTAAAYPGEGCVHELFEEQVLRTLDSVAVVCEDRQLTYNELNQQANQLAHYLRSLGVGPETLVGLCLERSLELVIAVLGILKAGGAYVPLDPTYPGKRLSFLVQDCHAALILTHSRFLDQLGEAQTRVVCVDKCKRAISAEGNKNLAIEMTPDQPLYVLYTSGSTGTPKGVVGLHRGTVNRVTWMWRTYPFAPDEVACLKTTFSFVDSVWEMFGGLLCGVRTIVIPDRTVKDPLALVNTLATHGVTRIVLVPSLLRVLLENCGDLRAKVPQLRIFISSGEALSLELSQRFRRMLPDARLINLYGSSEVAADVTCCDTTEDVLPTYIPIGRPIANTQVYVLDAQRQPVPISVPGELYVGGAGVARGYLNRPELTAERFVGNPFDDDPDSRLFRTGDLCRWRADGNLEFLGRLDGQVKLRGFRIELGEIESVLDEHPDVAQSVVTLREDHPGDKRLAAYYVPTTAIACEAEELRRFLGKRLPDYMVPSAYVFLQALPLTPNGKVDRRALPSISAAERRSAGFIEPRDNIERKLTKIWEELLGVETDWGEGQLL